MNSFQTLKLQLFPHRFLHSLKRLRVEINNNLMIRQRHTQQTAKSFARERRKSFRKKKTDSLIKTFHTEFPNTFFKSKESVIEKISNKQAIGLLNSIFS